MVFRGQYDCTMDDKGRIKMPAALRKQFPAEDGARFMIAKDIEDCLVIYPMKTWEKQEALLAKLNPFNLKHQQFINAITVGLTEMEMDNADRFLVAKSLVKYLGGNKEVILKGKNDRVQVWDANKYEQYTQGNIANIQALADEAAAHLDSLNEDKAS
ncbi:MAG TPA: division/cell wall cluster transcriptional repressor MraZ [Chitinophagales bacterium]|nr:division/cell wall cluster transcriptional repressor MraZ [Chitinophagales bacterium]